MHIHLNTAENHYMMKIAEEYQQKTGDRYSVKFICTLLEERYADNLEKDLDEILEEKVRLYEEAKARQGN